MSKEKILNQALELLHELEETFKESLTDDQKKRINGLFARVVAKAATSRKPKKSNKTILKTFEEVESFVNEWETEIITEGESDGWNQKMDVLNKIMKREKVEFGEGVTDGLAFDLLINNI